MGCTDGPANSTTTHRDHAVAGPDRCRLRGPQRLVRPGSRFKAPPRGARALRALSRAHCVPRVVRESAVSRATGRCHRRPRTQTPRALTRPISLTALAELVLFGREKTRRRAPSPPIGPSLRWRAFPLLGQLGDGQEEPSGQTRKRYGLRESTPMTPRSSRR
jgi:hypothetical protein